MSYPLTPSGGAWYRVEEEDSDCVYRPSGQGYEGCKNCGCDYKQERESDRGEWDWWKCPDCVLLKKS